MVDVGREKFLFVGLMFFLMVLMVPLLAADNASNASLVNQSIFNEAYNESVDFNESVGVEETKVVDVVLNVSTLQYRAVIGRPVKWLKKVALREDEGGRLQAAGGNLTIEIPKSAEDISVLTDGEVDEAEREAEDYDDLVGEVEKEKLVSGFLTGNVVADIDESEGILVKFWRWILDFRITGNVIVGEKLAEKIVEAEDALVVDLGEVVSETGADRVGVEYYTEAPEAVEESMEGGKRMTVSAPHELGYVDILAYSKLDREVGFGVVELYHVESDVRSEVEFDEFDLDGDGSVDYLEWTVPHLSSQVYEIIYITKAEHLNSDRVFVEDIYGDVRERDDVWSSVIEEGEYVRVTFEENLTSEKDITIYARSSEGASVEVYEKDGTDVIVKFDQITEDKKYRVLLGDLVGEQDVFDLKIVGGSLEFDYIVDPVAEWWNSSWHYRFYFSVNFSNYDRADWPVEVWTNFSAELENLNVSSDFDLDSLRVVEYNSTGSVLGEVVSQFETLEGYSEGGNAVGNVVFILNGTTAANVTREFYVYFDDGASPKTNPNYDTGLSYSASSDEFFLNNSVLELKIDTDRDEKTSGIYYARRLDAGETIFDTPSNERTVEYLRYYDGSDYFGYNFSGNMTLVTDGPVKIVVEQVGDEVEWNSDTLTNTGRMTKRYVIYENSSWVKIEHVFENTGGVSIDRRSNGITSPVLAFDVQRAFGMGGLTNSPLDPYGWSYVSRSSGGAGLGVININESTSNYDAFGSVVQGKIGIRLATTSVASGSTISEEAVVCFNDEASYVPVENIRNAFSVPIVVSKNESGGYDLNITTFTDFDLYNLNETIFITSNISIDTQNLTAYVNATLDNGTVATADDIVLVLYDDGLHDDGAAGDGFYGNNYSFNERVNVGSWNVTTTSYDSSFQALFSSVKVVDVTDEFYLDIVIDNPSGVVSRTVYASVNLTNLRGDVAILNADVSCGYGGIPVVNIVEDGGGIYSINFSAPGSLGTHELECNGTRYNNFGNDSETFYTEPETTTMGVSLDPSGVKVIYDVSQVDNQSFVLTVASSNTGSGTASDVNVTLDISSVGVVSNVSFYDCGNVLVGQSCETVFLITAVEGATSGNRLVTAYLSWTNPVGSQGSSSSALWVQVAANPMMNVVEDEMNGTIIEGTNVSLGNFTVNSVGNSGASGIEFNCTGGEVCGNFTFSFSPDSFSTIAAGTSEEVEVVVRVPVGYAAGNYSGVINVTSANAGYDNFSVNIEVPETSTWELVPVNCTAVVLVDDVDDSCLMTLENTGNMPLNFTITEIFSNYTSLNQSNFSLEKQEFGFFYVRHNTTGVAQGDYDSRYNVSVFPDATPSSVLLDVFLEVIFGPTLMGLISVDAEQSEDFLISVNVTDRSGAGIEWVKANVTLPDLSVESVELVNLTPVGLGGTSAWGYNYSNTVQRGEYQVLFYARDISGGSGWVSDSFLSYVKLNVSLETGAQDYLLGETGSIYYSVVDGAGDGLGLDMNITMRDSNSLSRYKEGFSTDSLGELSVVPTFSIPSDAPTGNYTISSSELYNDTVAGRMINDSFGVSFGVFNPFFVELDTVVVWYPDSVMTFYVLVYTSGDMKNTPTDIILNIFDPAFAVYTNATLGDFSIVQQTGSSVLYRYQYAMPAQSANGDYLATVEVQEGTKSFHDVHSFRVSSGGPYDLILNITDSEVAQNSNVPFAITMINMGETSQDVFLDYWVRSLDNVTYTKVTGEAIYTPAGGNVTIDRGLFILSDQAVGMYEIVVEMRYSNLVPTIITSRTFSVVVASEEAPEDDDSGGGGGGGGGGGTPITGEVVAGEGGLAIVSFDPESLGVERGGMSFVLIELKNIGNGDLTDISAELSLLNYTASSGVLKLLRVREEAVLPIRIDMPLDFPSGEYTGVIKVFSGDKEIEQDYNIQVFGSKEELILHRIEKIEKDVQRLEERVESARRDGVDVEEVDALLRKAASNLVVTKEYVNARKYLQAVNLLDDIENDIESGNYFIDSYGSSDVSFVISYRLLGIALIVLILLMLGIILVRMLLKRLRILRIRKFPKKVAARLEKVKEAESGVKTLKEQYDQGYISGKTYRELLNSNS